MLNSGKKLHVLGDKKNKYSNSLCCPKKKFWTKQKTITLPCKLNGRSLKNRSIDNLETQKKYISMKNSQFFNYLLYAKSK